MFPPHLFEQHCGAGMAAVQWHLDLQVGKLGIPQLAALKMPTVRVKFVQSMCIGCYCPHMASVQQVAQSQEHSLLGCILQVSCTATVVLHRTAHTAWHVMALVSGPALIAASVSGLLCHCDHQLLQQCNALLHTDWTSFKSLCHDILCCCQLLMPAGWPWQHGWLRDRCRAAAHQCGGADAGSRQGRTAAAAAAVLAAIRWVLAAV
jgi:hypothetical protein